jgi:hypothetical protein
MNNNKPGIRYCVINPLLVTECFYKCLTHLNPFILFNHPIL